MSARPVERRAERLVAVVRKNNHEEFRFTVAKSHGRHIASVRLWFSTDDGEMRPSKEGLAVHVELAIAIADALRLTAIEARQ